MLGGNCRCPVNMKHNTKITIILVAMFIITQLIGLFVISNYNNGLTLPYGMEPPTEVKEKPGNFGINILFAFAFAVILFFILTKIKAEKFIRFWFFTVTIIALGLTINVFLLKINIINASIISLIIAIPLAYIKIFKRDVYIHNFTELLIYPGIAAVFVPIINVFWIIIFLLLISLYDIWAVWHSEIMQKMAKYQINNLRLFTGFFIPYADKKQKAKIKMIKNKYVNKSQKFMEKQFKKAKIKVNLAILGGGDIIFPIITAGIFYETYHSLASALIISAFATIALLFLFILARKGKFYPAMPFLTIGIYLGMIVNWLI